MHESSDWRELGARFTELGKDSSKDFSAEWSPDAGLADHWYFTAVNDPSTPKDFINASERGAALLGCPEEKLGLSFWLDEIKRHGSHYESAYIIAPGSNDEPGEYKEHGFVRRVCLASAEHCYCLETRAIAAERQVPPTPQNATQTPIPSDMLANRPSEQIPFPRRARWLKDCLRERGWNRNDPARYHGPDPKTVDKILTGARVRESVLEALARSLSARVHEVAPLDIPDD